MSTLRYISAGGAVLLSAAVASVFTMDALSNRPASAEDIPAHAVAVAPANAAAPTDAGPVAPTRKVRVIDLSAENAASSDQSKWHNRARKPPVQKNTAKAEVVRSESRPERPKKRVVRRAPTEDARSAYASEQAPRRGGFGLFDW